VAELILFLHPQLSHGLPQFMYQEDRVVAEALCTAFLSDDFPSALPYGDLKFAGWTR